MGDHCDTPVTACINDKDPCYHRRYSRYSVTIFLLHNISVAHARHLILHLSVCVMDTGQVITVQV